MVLISTFKSYEINSLSLENENLLKSKGLTYLNKQIKKNRKYKLLCKTCDGYLVLVALSSIKLQYAPSLFGNGNPYTINNIKNYLKINNLQRYDLITEKWNDANTKLKWRVWRSTGYYYFSTSWGNFQHGHRPSENAFISGDWRRINKKDMISEINKLLSQEKFNGWSVDEKSVFKCKNIHEKFCLSHSNGYKFQLSLAELRVRLGIRVLNSNRKEISTHNMYILVKEKTPYRLKKFQKYVGMYDDYIFVCETHGEFVGYLSNVLKRGSGCQKCANERTSGENHHNWNPDREEDERIRKREFKSYRQWRKEVFERDSYTCQYCGTRGAELAAHHKDAYHWCKERRLDVSNGVTLCKDCHYKFHSMYSSRNNTESQWIEFIKAKTTGKSG